MIQIKKGLDLPIAGRPEQRIEAGASVQRVALLGNDYIGMKPTMEVAEGDRVKRGQVLFSDKKNAGVVFTAPAAGTVSAVNRGAKRVLLSVVIDIDGDEALSFPTVAAAELVRQSRSTLQETLVTSGLWTALRTRPFSRIPALDANAHAIFVNAMDTNPLAGDPSVVIAEAPDAFSAGLDVLSTLTQGTVFVCHAPDKQIPSGTSDRIRLETFSGPHPAGLPGTHIHYLDPVSADKTVWTIGYQDVIAFGELFLTGTLPNRRVVALAGPGAKRPRLVRTLLGASLEELSAGECAPGEQRIISGSVFSGRIAAGPEAFLGRYHNQVSILPEDRERRLFGYLSPGPDRHSVFPIYLSKWLGRKTISFSTTTNGSPRGMVPIGTYESVMPLDILATQLLRSLLVKDLDTAINLGCLELDEEDLALCTYACPGKYEYGPVLRQVLDQIAKEG